MCGICGSFSVDGISELDTAATVDMIKLMERRGGGWRRCVEGPTPLRTGISAAFHSDLSSPGDQPMITPDGRYVIVYNGEVYNFRELREELQQKGIVFVPREIPKLCFSARFVG